MADDPTQSVADSPVSDPNIIPPPESASSDPNRPVSTILADSPTEPKTPLADPGSDYTAPVQADLSGVVSAQTDSPIATESASVAPSPSTPPADVSTEASAKVGPPPIPAESPRQPAADPVSVAPEPVEPSFPSIPPDPSVPSLPPEVASGGSIQDSLPSDLPSQVQPSESNVASDAPVSQEPKTTPQSAEIKPEPPEGTQNAPLADSGTPIFPKTSFGDLTERPSAEEPTINIVPIEPPKPVQAPLPRDPSQTGTWGISPQPPTETVIEAKADFSVKRQQALQTRRKKREDHLAKILTLVSQKGKIRNSDIVALLRVSQSTATNYLHSLIKDGKIKKEGKAKATIYSL